MLFRLISKDLLLFSRSSARSVAVMMFAMVLVILASFAFRQVGYSQADLREMTPGILWIIYLFAGVTALNHAFVSEQENDALRGLMHTAVDPAVLYLSKFLTSFVFIVLMQALVCIAHAVFFGVDMPILLVLLLVVLVSIGFVALGTILSAISTAVPGREILLPLALFPLCVPLLIAAVSLTRAILETSSFPFASFWFLLIGVFDIVSFTLSLVLFEHVLRE